MRYTEQELREFLELHAHEFADVDQNAEFYDRGYSRGAYDAYKFVLRFMDEYRLEDVSNTKSTLEQDAETRALGHVLSDWSDLTWDEVIDILKREAEVDWCATVQDKRITVWEPFEDETVTFIYEQLWSHRREFLESMDVAIQTTKEQ
jgi:hypothetical protein